MADVGGAFLQVAVEKLVSGGIDLILKHVKGNEKIDSETLPNLKKTLRLVAALLKDAQQRRIQSEAYKVWVEDLQDLAFDLEDILDELATNAQLLQLHQPDHDNNHGDGASTLLRAPFLQLAKKAKSILTCGSRATQHFHYHSSGDLLSKIEEMNRRLENFHSRGLILGLTEPDNMQQGMYYSTEATIQNTFRETTSLNRSEIYGRKNRKNEIIQRLLNEEPSKENYVVIPIVGIGGIGKTTLAQYVYNDPEITKHFKFKAWVCVSDKVFNVARVTRDIINSATGKSLNLEILDQTQHRLTKELEGKRFLIVLDDVWTDNYNDCCQLYTPFKYGATGSRVIVTTRHEKTARMMMSENPTHPIINLEKLSNDDCWHIFLQHLCQNVDDELTEMQSDIIRKCDGLPLAAKALGGLFKMTVCNFERQRLLNSNIWSEKGDVLPVLRLSYFHLPSELKHIFAYCSIFPKDFEFNEKEVVLLWMAQGFLPENQQESMEVIGRCYFFDLVSRSLFEPSPSDEECYVMHDLVHDLSQWAAGDICHYVTDTKHMQGDLTRTRHLNLSNNVTDRINQMITHKLRTFICQTQEYVDGFSILEFSDFISRIRCTRSLSLASESIEDLPECIGDLKHLRYLNLKFTNITVLPKSIEKLWNLQTLFLIGCHSLREGIDFRFLVNLRHILFPRTLWEAMPLGIIGKLTNLQTLGKMYLGDDHERRSMIRELRNLNQICGKLNVIGLQNVRAVEDAKEVRLDKKKGVEQLRLKWLRDGEDEFDDNTESDGEDEFDDKTESDGEDEADDNKESDGEDEVDDNKKSDGEDEVDDNTKTDVLEQLKPNSCIKECELDGYMGLTLPSWLGDPSFKNMVDIKLVNCEKCEWVPPLGQLPSLKKLLIKNLKVWAGWWHDSKARFPCLEVLVIEECESFKGNLPPHLPYLKILRVNKCLEATISPPNSSHLENLEINCCKELVSSTGETLVIRCSKSIYLKEIESGFTGLVVGGSCSDKFYIRSCDSLVTINKIPLTIRNVYIVECKKLERVEWEESSASSASNDKAFIVIKTCDSIIGVGNIPLTVKSLNVERCKSLKSVMCCGQWNLFDSSKATDGDGGGGGGQLQLAHLAELYISNCPKFMSLPNDVLLPSIRIMVMSNNENQGALPEIMHAFTSNVLWISHCPNIHKFPGGGLPRNLTILKIEEMNITQPIQEWRLDLLTHLRYLMVENIGSSGDLVQEIENRRFVRRFRDVSGCCSRLYLSSTSLLDMVIADFKNLKSIKCSTFPNLTKLFIENCPNLESLGPNNCLPPKIEEVKIRDCPLIQQQCKPDPNGPILLDDDRYTIS